jgi:hypothetical protein
MGIAGSDVSKIGRNYILVGRQQKHFEILFRMKLLGFLNENRLNKNEFFIFKLPFLLSNLEGD